MVTVDGLSASSARVARGGRRRRSVPLLVVGVVVVGGCVLVSAQVAARAGHRLPVLAAARDVPVGRVVTPADLRVVRVAADPGVRLVAASERGRVVGRPAVVPVAAGDLLPASLAGAVRVFSAGQSVVGLAVKAGQYPPGLARGVRVRIVMAASSEVTVDGSAAGHADANGPGEVSATAVSVQRDALADGGAVVAVQVASGAAADVVRAAARGQVGIVQDGQG